MCSLQISEKSTKKNNEQTILNCRTEKEHQLSQESTLRIRTACDALNVLNISAGNMNCLIIWLHTEPMYNTKHTEDKPERKSTIGMPSEYTYTLPQIVLLQVCYNDIQI